MGNSTSICRWITWIKWQVLWTLQQKVHWFLMLKDQNVRSLVSSHFYKANPWQHLFPVALQNQINQIDLLLGFVIYNCSLALFQETSINCRLNLYLRNFIELYTFQMGKHRFTCWGILFEELIYNILILSHCQTN